MEEEDSRQMDKEVMAMAGTNCPRCSSAKTKKAADSPVKGAFEIRVCENCRYVWRSTEDTSKIVKMTPQNIQRATNHWPEIKYEHVEI